jgi:glycosyltransferase involved in cell wall biosynthesis
MTDKSRKPRLLYFSPLPPQKSGIADYSEVLLQGLKEHFEITVVIDQPQLVNGALYNLTPRELAFALNPKLFAEFSFLVWGVDPLPWKNFDFAIYNIGNNPYYHRYIYEAALAFPGLVILHDSTIFYLVVGYYQDRSIFWQKIRTLGGENAVRALKAQGRRRLPFLQYREAHRFPMSRELLESGCVFMVHAENAKQAVLAEAPSLLPEKVVKISHIDYDYVQQSKTQNLDALRDKFSIPKDAIVVASFGYIAPTKQNHLICEAVRQLGVSPKKVAYVMVGEGHYADAYIDGSTVIKTGFVDLNDFMGLIQLSDIIFNLRYPSMGETSGSLLRILGAGKPCIITNDAWFSEIPSDVVIKVEPNVTVPELSSILKSLIDSPETASALGDRARRYVKAEHAVPVVAEQIRLLLENSKKALNQAAATKPPPQAFPAPTLPSLKSRVIRRLKSSIRRVMGRG